MQSQSSGDNDNSTDKLISPLNNTDETSKKIVMESISIPEIIIPPSDNSTTLQLNNDDKNTSFPHNNDNTCNSPFPENSHALSKSTDKKSVSFLSAIEEPILNVCEPYNYWEQNVPCSADVLYESYLQLCAYYKCTAVPLVLEQIKGLNPQVCSDRYDMLSLRGYKLTWKDIECLEAVFKRVQFQLLDFENTNLDDTMACSFFDIIEYYQSCTKLNISFNTRLSVPSFQNLAKLLRRIPCLEALNLRGLVFTDSAMPLFVRSLRVPSTNSTSNINSFMGLRMSASFSRLVSLNLEDCNVNSRNLVILMAALQTNPFLVHLCLGGNNLQRNDGTSLGALLKANTCLKTLDLRNNFLGDVGVSHICDGLFEQISDREGGLEILNLWNNCISHLAMLAMGQALKRCAFIKTLNLGGNNLLSEGIQSLRDGLLFNRSLKHLLVTSCKLNCEAGVAFAEYIADTKNLERLDLRENDIKTAGLLALSLALKVNKSVIRLDVDKSFKREANNRDYQETQALYLQMIECQINENVKYNAELEVEKMKKDLEGFRSVNQVNEEREMEEKNIDPSALPSKEMAARLEADKLPNSDEIIHDLLEPPLPAEEGSLLNELTDDLLLLKTTVSSQGQEGEEEETKEMMESLSRLKYLKADELSQQNV